MAFVSREIVKMEIFILSNTSEFTTMFLFQKVKDTKERMKRKSVSFNFNNSFFEFINLKSRIMF